MEAQRLVKKADRIFSPLKLRAEDAKPLYSPVSYLVIDGMQKSVFKKVSLLDSKKPRGQKSLQTSIAKAFSQNKTDWITVRVDNKGKLLLE